MPEALSHMYVARAWNLVMTVTSRKSKLKPLITPREEYLSSKEASLLILGIQSNYNVRPFDHYISGFLVMEWTLLAFTLLPSFL